MSMEIWNGTDSFYDIGGNLCTPQDVHKRWPFSQHVPIVLGKQGGLVGSVDSLPLLVEVYEIDPELCDEEKLAEIARALDRARNPLYDDVEEALAILNGEVE